MKRKFWLLGLVMSMLLTLMLTGCFSNSTEKDSVANSTEKESVASSKDNVVDSEDLLADGVLKIGLDDEWPPMEFRNDQESLVGFDIDFANALAEELGVKAEFSPVPWDGIFNGLNATQYDVIISSTSITPERQEEFCITDPYVTSGVVIVSRTNVEPVTNFSQLKGKSLFVMEETAAEITAETLKAQSGIDADIQILRSKHLLLEDWGVDGKENVYFMMDNIRAEQYVKQFPDDFVISSNYLSDDQIGIICRKGNSELVKKLNAAIDALQKDGTMTRISNVWFGKDLTTDIN